MLATKPVPHTYGTITSAACRYEAHRSESAFHGFRGPGVRVERPEWD